MHARWLGGAVEHCHTPTPRAQACVETSFYFSPFGLIGEMTPGQISEQLGQLECPTDGNDPTCLLLFGGTAHVRDESKREQIRAHFCVVYPFDENATVERF